LAAAILYVGWVFLNRYWDEAGQREKLRRQKEASGALPSDLSTSELKILQFYATPPEVAPGQQGLVCYGVINAASVRIDPGNHVLTSSLSRCIQVSPKSTTTFTLTATDAKGQHQTATVELRVRAGAAGGTNKSRLIAPGSLPHPDAK
jgi:hypothetical protein